VIPPRRRDPGGDPALVGGLLGAVALLDRLRGLIAELAADPPGDDHAPADAEVVDVLLGLAALAEAVEHRLPRAQRSAAAPCEEALAPPRALEELLR